MGYLASIARSLGHMPLILDMAVRKIRNERINEIIKMIQPDLVGISSITFNYNGMKVVSNLIKNHNPDIPVILGGIHVSALPETSLHDCNADVVAIGEGEAIFKDLLEYYSGSGTIALEDIHGIVFRKDEKTHQTPPRIPNNDLDSIPFPSWDLIKPWIYPAEPHSFLYKKKPIFSIIATRGCPYQCSFCSSTHFWGHKVRMRSPKNIVDEIEYLITKFGAKEIHFWDDNITFHRDFIINFCREILRRKIKIFLDIPNGVRIDSIDALVLKFMKSAGFYSITYAVESGDQKILNRANKSLNLSKIKKPIDLSKKFGFTTRSFFIFGLPGENYESLQKSMILSQKMKFDTTNYFIAQPLPGSQLFREWTELRSIDPKKFDWRKIHFFTTMDEPVMTPISNKILKKYQKIAYIKFYLLRPWHLWVYIKYIKPHQIFKWFRRTLSMISS